MSSATISALLLFMAALLQSASYLCNKLPAERRPEWFPRERLTHNLFDLGWILLFIAGVALAFKLNLWLGVVAVTLYFLGLPFVFQPALARLMGYRDLRDLVDDLEDPP